jgi:hypothetical protein
MNAKSTIFAAVAAVLVSTATLGATVAPAASVQLPVRIAVNA